ncbi:MFS transporter [Bacillus sp. 1P06AnD]|uniref:MFS transporter n=1 Tax=Bacillus sp. 1P06AnD TaxID=3132208 RepID=UPI0039A149F1
MDQSKIEKRAINKMTWRLMPFCIFLYIVNIIDRGNLGFTALDMNAALGIEAAAFGLLTSIFFIGYFFLEVPSNMAMHRFGAKLWIGRIMITWGLVTCGVFFAQSFTHVAILRFLLGVCEAGFFPGMIYYFTFWFPMRYRARITSIFFIAGPIAAAIGAPISTLIMDHVSWLGQDGWRWVYMLEGIAAVVGGIFCFIYLTDKPQDAKWLTQEEKDWVVNEIAAEDAMKTETAHFTLGKVFKYGKVWRLAFIYMFIQITTQALSFWSPTLVKEFSAAFSNTTVGFIMMLPPIVGLIAMLYWGKHSDQKGERVKHTALPMIVFVLALGLMMAPGIPMKLIGLTLTGVASYSFYGPYWAIPTIYLSGEAAAIGVAIINSMSSFGGFAGNLAVGFIKESILGTTGVFVFLLLCALIAFFMTITLKMQKQEKLKEIKSDTEQPAESIV